MFAMLTGNLPFTVQPFTIKALYAKMIAGDMNTLPDYLSNSTMPHILAQRFAAQHRFGVRPSLCPVVHILKLTHQEAALVRPATYVSALLCDDRYTFLHSCRSVIF